MCKTDGMKWISIIRKAFDGYFGLKMLHWIWKSNSKFRIKSGLIFALTVTLNEIMETEVQMFVPVNAWFLVYYPNSSKKIPFTLYASRVDNASNLRK